MPVHVQRTIALCVLCMAVAAIAATGQEIRLANGKPVQGTLVQVKPEGLEVNTPAGLLVLTWETLSAGTRFRHQESYRVTFTNILDGASPAERAALFEARKSESAPEATAESKKSRKKKAEE